MLTISLFYFTLAVQAYGWGLHMNYTDAMKLYATHGTIPLEPIKHEVAPSLAHFYKWTTKRAIYKTHFVDLRLHQGKKAYVDCGAREYKSSIGGWFHPDYPQSEMFDEIVGFEVMKKYWKSYGRRSRSKVELHNLAVWKENATVTFSPERTETFKMATINSGGPQGLAGEFEIQAIDFADFLQRRFTQDDFVVVKVDIEGAEYAVLDRLISTGAIDLVDDLYVEWHFEEFHGKAISQGKKREDAVDQLKRLRAVGAFAHEYA
mmetsp:Transcript_39056/g.124346  ORF Transcript_39056/g.124346 Transcript_39056/m.124346 type:complete len:262 (+) Transcript_39056:303-1088(+)